MTNNCHSASLKLNYTGNANKFGVEIDYEDRTIRHFTGTKKPDH